MVCSLQLAYAQKPDADMQKAVRTNRIAETTAIILLIAVNISLL